ncbi:ABC transporter ATP-binding protein [Clostridium saccharoperbutylacetonicum]|uniref:ABC transporter ATP-binding protein n=1 Tax=Clostridium saccharoperbutylacetonicum TaxID=36745 RepID=UPI0039E7E402
MNDRIAIKKLLSLLKPYTKKIVFITFFLIISTLINMVLPLMSRRIIDEGFLGNNFNLILYSVLVILALVLIDKIINVVKEMFRAEICAKLKYSLYDTSFTQLVKMRIHNFNNTNYAEQLNNINMDIENISKITDGSLFFIVTQVFNILGGFIGLFLIDYHLTVIVIFFIPIKYVLVKYFAGKRRNIMTDSMERSGDFAQWFGDAIGGIREIKLFNLSDLKYKEFKKKQNPVINLEKKGAILDVWNMSSDAFVLQFFVSAIYIIGAYMVFNKGMTVGSVLAFITYSSYVTTPITAILNIGYIIVGIIPSTKRYYEFLSMDIEETVDEKSIIKLDKNEEVIIEFKNVYFSYIDGQPILKNISFSLKNGEKVALIGLNGSGKSTIINLILRFYSPSEGEILLNGINIEKYDINEYRGLISSVSQSIYLFDTTIRNNIFLYKDYEEEVYQELVRVLDLKRIDDIFPNDCNVGQNGIMLSGGQRQKIAIGRLLARDSKIVILDEATSNLDIDAENNLNRLLDYKLLNKTTIIISHKPDILEKADKIIFLDKGTINEMGTHDELIKNNTLYQQLIEQFKQQSDFLT